MRDRTLWTWHVFAGLVILVLLGLHMGIMHLDRTLGIGNAPGAAPTDWASVVLRMKSMGFAVTYVLLLGTALYHGLYGLRNILCELGPGPALQKVMNVGFWAAGLLLFGFGSWVALNAPRAAAAVGG